LEDLDLSMVYLPPSKKYGFAEYELRYVCAQGIVLCSPRSHDEA
jgi:hypothetical protein